MLQERNRIEKADFRRFPIRTAKSDENALKNTLIRGKSAGRIDSIVLGVCLCSRKIKKMWHS